MAQGCIFIAYHTSLGGELQRSAMGVNSFKIVEKEEYKAVQKQLANDSSSILIESVVGISLFTLAGMLGVCMGRGMGQSPTIVASSGGHVLDTSTPAVPDMFDNILELEVQESVTRAREEALQNSGSTPRKENFSSRGWFQSRRHHLMAAVAAVVSAPQPALAERNGVQIFLNSCAACHAGGGNVVARGKTSDRAALAKNQVDNTEAIATLVRNGRGQMPGFGEACAPKPACTFGPRLVEEEVLAVAEYVDARADDGEW